jgi:hypothetical protein
MVRISDTNDRNYTTKYQVTLPMMMVWSGLKKLGYVLTSKKVHSSNVDYPISRSESGKGLNGKLIDLDQETPGGFGRDDDLGFDFRLSSKPG